MNRACSLFVYLSQASLVPRCVESLGTRLVSDSVVMYTTYNYRVDILKTKDTLFSVVDMRTNTIEYCFYSTTSE